MDERDHFLALDGEEIVGAVRRSLKWYGIDWQPGEPAHQTGFMISCFPFKILKVSAGFTRAVAIFED